MRYQVFLWQYGPSPKADVTYVIEARGIDAAIQEAMRVAGFSFVHLAWTFPVGMDWHGEGRFQVSRPGSVSRGR